MTWQAIICKLFLVGVAPQDIGSIGSDYFYVLRGDFMGKCDMWWFFDVTSLINDVQIACTLFEGNFIQWKKNPSDWSSSETSAIDKVSIFIRNYFGAGHRLLNDEKDWKVEYVEYKI